MTEGTLGRIEQFFPIGVCMIQVMSSKSLP